MAGTVGTSAGPARAGSGGGRGRTFRFAPTFVVDFIVSSFHAGLFLYCWPRASHTTLVCVLAGALGAAIALCYSAKCSSSDFSIAAAATRAPMSFRPIW